MEEQRYPLSVRMVGVLHKGKSKVSTDDPINSTYVFLFLFYFLLPPVKIRLLLFQLYVVSVLWSDQNDIVIYRTLRDFKKMHVSYFFFPCWLCA